MARIFRSAAVRCGLTGLRGLISTGRPAAARVVSEARARGSGRLHTATTAHQLQRLRALLLAEYDECGARPLYHRLFLGRRRVCANVTSTRTSLRARLTVRRAVVVGRHVSRLLPPPALLLQPTLALLLRALLRKSAPPPARVNPGRRQRSPTAASHLPAIGLLQQRHELALAHVDAIVFARRRTQRAAP